jgi:hypothetical protein
MTHKKNERQTLSLPVTENLTVTIIPSSDHEFLMPTKEVALGYGICKSRLSHHLKDHSDELIEGKHFISGVRFPHSASPGSSKGTLWTKRGIVRLGFFIKSERAKLFRDWAEDLVIKLSEAKQPLKALPAKRKHNRLTPERLADILADVCLIEDKGVRVSLTNKLTGRA